MTLFQHWRRGALICALIGLVIFASLLGAALAVAILLLPIEVVVSNFTAAILEDHYLVVGIAVFIALLLPIFLSQAQEQLGSIS